MNTKKGHERKWRQTSSRKDNCLKFPHSLDRGSCTNPRVKKRTKQNRLKQNNTKTYSYENG